MGARHRMTRQRGTVARGRGAPRPGRRRAVGVGAVTLVVVGVLVGGCGPDGSPDGSGDTRVDRSDDDVAVLGTVTLLDDADEPVAPVAEPSGTVLVGERLTGRILRLDPAAAGAAQPVGRVEATGASDDQRGLLGLAVDRDGALFAAWTRPEDLRLVVGEVRPDGTTRLVWEGPASAERANGGHLVAPGDGRLLIGIGDLLADPALADDPDLPNRKVLALDPGGPPTQRPAVLSTGWNNPFALAVDGDGVPWVADNSPGDAPERLGQADRPADLAVPLDGDPVAPAALLWTADGRPAVCGYLSGRVLAYRIDDTAARPTDTLAEPCRTGAAVLSDGRLVLLTEDRVLVTDRAPLGRR